MKGALAVLNDLEAGGLLGRYAIGGAMGAMFYVEPVTTYDLDIFDAERLADICARHGLPLPVGHQDENPWTPPIP